MFLTKEVRVDQDGEWLRLVVRNGDQRKEGPWSRSIATIEYNHITYGADLDGPVWRMDYLHQCAYRAWEGGKQNNGHEVRCARFCQRPGYCDQHGEMMRKRLAEKSKKEAQKSAVSSIIARMSIEDRKALRDMLRAQETEPS